MEPIADILRWAMELHQAGQLADAERIYQQVLARDPRQSHTLHLLGAIAFQRGQNERAIDLVQRAIAINPSVASYYNTLGNALNALERQGDAIQAYRQALALKPDLVEAHHNLGNALYHQKHFDEAAAAFRAALRLKPNFVEARNNLANALRAAGKFDEAVDTYRQILADNPASAVVHFNLGIALSDRGSLDEAISAFRRAVELQPNYAEAYLNLGKALRKKDLLQEAIAACREALRLKPHDAEVYVHLAAALMRAGLLEESIAAYAQCAALHPQQAEAHYNLANALRIGGFLEESIASHRRALSLRPDHAEGHWNLAIALLLKADFEEGWREAEWRWRREEQNAGPRKFAQPLWDGADLDGRTILLHAEQGFGDTLQFVRYVSMVKSRGGRVVLECQPALVRLLVGFAGVDHLVAATTPLPAFDVHSPLMTLPLIFNTTSESIPAAVPYIHANADLSREWAVRLPVGTGLKVGIVWAGSTTYGNDRIRSMTLSTMAPLARVEGIRLYSLQKREPARQASALPEGMDLIDHTALLEDFADTAAFIANLDLVIAVDTAVAHLAGALGKPVWVLVPYAPDWRWQLGREDSAWYPTVRLFRQRKLGDWPEVVEMVVAALAEFVRERAGRDPKTG